VNRNIIFGVAIVVLLLVVIGFYSSNAFSKGAVVKNGEINVNGDSSAVIQADGNTKVISISAQKYDYTPNIIRVKKGEHVKIILDNKDAKHGIVIPSLNLRGVDSLEFNADKSGTYEFYCPTFCGQGHSEMKGIIVVEE
jgi:cytochrome c oxidase subunit 2